MDSIQELIPIIHEIKYTGVELSPTRQRQLDFLSQKLRDGQELAEKVLSSSRWNVYKNLQLARKMEKLEKTITRFVHGPMQAHVLADVHHVRFDMAERFDRIEGSTRRLERRLGGIRIGIVDGESSGGWIGEEVKTVEEVERWGGIGDDGCLMSLGAGMELGKRKVKEMLVGQEDLNVVGIFGIGGSGKTTLAREICRDDQVKSKYFLAYNFEDQRK